MLGTNWLNFHEPTTSSGSIRSLALRSVHCSLNCLDQGIPDTINDNGNISNSARRQTNAAGDICTVSAAAACLADAHHLDQITRTEPYHQDQTERPPQLFDKDVSHAAYLAAITRDYFIKYIARMERAPMSDADVKALKPAFVCKELKDCFHPKLADQLLLHQPGVDYAIPGVDNTPRPRMYGPTRTETGADKAYTVEITGNGFVRPSITHLRLLPPKPQPT
ncbi:hypothetical protein P153DRAFT_145237 [Dothidotthia symphoricarpi CBS 119687]|uniref:Uncharacterized protein n=1 Tax=Dothidotthia symphoricarpi CBS 119687 TaxID=1392245 RepID=A0A6A5ZXU9_9PLEO|nr:uncharacterized protein P153DRAFT_145237 [Dothidotthia symphoricarpi CBS 119687]KAF2123733.1 hypothetical protein P153DRAFT_145237 [Dothidotthia symphoricarpi CBS 119687]